MNKDTIFFQYYPGDIKKCRPIGTLTLNQYIDKTRNPRNPEKFGEIKAAKAEGNLGLADKLKKRLLTFTPAVIVDGWRNQKSIISFTGLFPVDFDKMTPAEAVGFKEYLFYHYPFFYSVWLSASGHGVRGFIQVPVVQSVEEYRDYYFAIEAEFIQYEYKFDTQLKNPVQPMFQSFDPDILYRPESAIWTVKAVKAPPPQPSQTGTPNFNYSDKQRQKAAEIIIKGFTTRFNNIVDVGHPNVRSIAYTAGGYIAGGYLDESDVILLMDGWIDSHNYLRQKTDTYKRTVREMINRGKAQPLTLKTKSYTTRPTDNN